MYCDDRRIYPVYEYCERHGIPVLLMGGGGNGPDLSHSNPEHIDRVCGEFPNMTVINTHGGYPWVQQICFTAFKRPNLYLCPDMYMYNIPGVSDYVMAANTFLQDRFVFGHGLPLHRLQGRRGRLQGPALQARSSAQAVVSERHSRA